MAVLILSEDIPELKDTLATVQKVAQVCNFRFSEESQSDSDMEGAEVYFDKGYKDQEAYMYLLIESEQEVDRAFELHNLQYAGRAYYRIGVADQAKYDRLIYDFALAYLRLKPKHCISLYGKDFFLLSDLEELEKTGGYRKDWCYPTKGDF